MRTLFLLLALAGALAWTVPTPPPPEPTMKQLTPVLLVEAVEPCLAFWEERLGFERTIEVPHGEQIGFAAVERGNVGVMYQSRASVAADVPHLAQGSFDRGGVGLFIEVASLDAVLPALEGIEVVVPERTTFYGAREIFVRAPCGTLVGFAEMTQGE
ncbi:MAG: hypothetical protein PVF27_10260 [Gemmatimonadales bacterium]|jgi:uncharacterized glyoxalase superfamily protein PhnB